MAAETPDWLRKPPKPSRVKLLLAALAGVSWFTLGCVLLTFAGLLQGVIGVYYTNWYCLAFAAIYELAAANCFLLASREDQ